MNLLTLPKPLPLLQFYTPVGGGIQRWEGLASVKLQGAEGQASTDGGLPQGSHNGRPITVTTLLRICDTFRVPMARLVWGLDRESTGTGIETTY